MATLDARSDCCPGEVSYTIEQLWMKFYRSQISNIDRFFSIWFFYIVKSS